MQDYIIASLKEDIRLLNIEIKALVRVAFCLLALAISTAIWTYILQFSHAVFMASVGMLMSSMVIFFLAAMEKVNKAAVSRSLEKIEKGATCA